jgi:hypothetical protein
MFQGMHDRRLTLEAVEPLSMGQALSVQYDDSLFLCEVLTCFPSGSRWSIELKVEQILNGLQSLINLRLHLMDEGVPQSAPTAPAAVLKV